MKDALIDRRCHFFVTGFKLRSAVVMLLTAIALTGCAARESSDFEVLRKLVCEAKYEQAIPKLKAYVGPHESRARLFLGKAWMGQGDYSKAKVAFESGIQDFPRTLEAHKCQYKLALICYLQGDVEVARQKFQRLADLTDGPLIAEATAFAKRLSR